MTPLRAIEAAACFRRSAHPYRAFRYRGRCHSQRLWILALLAPDKPWLAEAALRRAIALDPQRAGNALNLADLLRKQMRTRGLPRISRPGPLRLKRSTADPGS